MRNVGDLPAQLPNEANNLYVGPPVWFSVDGTGVPVTADSIWIEDKECRERHVWLLPDQRARVYCTLISPWEINLFTGKSAPEFQAGQHTLQVGVCLSGDVLETGPLETTYTTTVYVPPERSHG